METEAVHVSAALFQAVQNKSDKLFTVGDFQDEEQAKSSFRDAISWVNSLRTGKLFTVYEEVECCFIGNRLFANRERGRMDFILSPTPLLIDLGWKNGFVGVEVKKSGHQANDLINQMLDYSRAVFELDRGGIRGACSLVACYPELNHSGGLISSLFANNRLCQAKYLPERSFALCVASTNAICVRQSGVYVNEICSGKKNGSR